MKPLALLIAAMGVSMANPAFAGKFEFDNGITGSFDTTISLGFQKRLEAPKSSIIGNDNGGSVPTTSPLGNFPGNYADPNFNYTNIDDGDLNFKKNQIVSSVIKGTHELFLKDQGNWAALGRFTWSSDFSAYKTERTPLDPEAKDAVRQSVSLLDLWVSKELEFGDNSAKVKFGNQIINWGEDIFIMGGVNSINSLDIRKAHIPGTQLKEIFIPSPMLSLSTGLGKGFSLETYYQFRWNKFIFDPAGTFWSNADFIGKGGHRGAFVPSSLGGPGDFDPSNPARTLAAIDAVGGRIPVEIDRARNSGQYGASLRFKPKEGDTEYAAYYIRFHDKLPFVGFRQAGASNMFNVSAVEQYGEDRTIFGASMNTKVGDLAVGAELSYRPKDSVAIDPTVPGSGQYSVFALAPGELANGYKDEKKYQAHLNTFYLLPPMVPSVLGAAEGYVMGEVAYTLYPSLDLSGNVPYLLNNYTLPSKRSWGYVAEFGLTYANLFGSGWTVSPILDWYHDVKGVSPNTIPFIEGRKAINLGFNFDYHNTWKTNVSYTTYFGGGNLNLLKDRDVLSASLSYIF
jgi:hypothetical protein